MADVYTMMVQAINYRLQQQYNGFFLVCFFFYSSHIKKYIFVLVSSSYPLKFLPFQPVIQKYILIAAGYLSLLN